MRYLDWSDEEITAFNTHIAEQDRIIKYYRRLAMAQTA